MQNSHSNRHLTLFDVLITAHVICPTAELFVDRCSYGIDLKKFCLVKGRKYNTIVNITTYKCNSNIFTGNCSSDPKFSSDKLF